MLKIGVCVSGGGSNLQAIIDSIKTGFIPAELAVVVSNNAKAYALERARANGIDAVFLSRVKYPDQNEYDAKLLAIFQRRGVELVVTAGFIPILGPVISREYRGRIINVHPSLIPSFCGKGFYGLRVHEAVLERGVKVTGATVHFADEGTDTGPIILQKAVEVEEGDTPEMLQRRVMEQAEWVILPEALKLYAEGRLTIKDNRVTVKGVCKA
jgi:phosphoribosylglycinamide formyltransferase-1